MFFFCKTQDQTFHYINFIYMHCSRIHITLDILSLFIEIPANKSEKGMLVLIVCNFHIAGLKLSSNKTRESRRPLAAQTVGSSDRKLVSSSPSLRSAS